MSFELANRIQELPPYLFAEIDRKKKEASAAGKDVINLGVGDPDRPTPPVIVQSMQQQVTIGANHQYALDQGHPRLRETISRWFTKRYGVELDPNTEILPTMGSKDGIAHLPLALINPGDVTLAPDPCYPVYCSGTTFLGGEVHRMPLLRENDFLPDLGAIPADVVRRAKLMWLNFPTNPTTAVADLEFFKQAVAFADEHDLIIAQDAAYNEVYYDEPPPSMLEVDGAKQRVIEFHSFSKTFNMTGWRIGFAAGGAHLVGALGKVKSNCDSGVFTAVQMATVTALENYDRLSPQINRVYRERRDVLVEGLQRAGWDIQAPQATFFVWAPCPGGLGSLELCDRLLSEASIVATPGIGLGAAGDGYVRLALTVTVDRIKEACDRIAELKL